MSLDFTLEKYRELCEAVTKLQYTVLTVGTYLVSQNLPQKYIILRHDVDRNPNRALQMARLEHEFNINTSYYFRFNKRTFQPNLVREISAMGHEIGYHYETLDKARGDYKKAIRIFEEELRQLREICDVKTICMHGNPLTKWDNRDLWRKYDFKDFGLLGEAYLSFNEITYLSDSGRNWGTKHKVKDWLPSAAFNCSKSDKSTMIGSTNDIIEMVEKGELEPTYLLVHPSRWSINLFDWIIELLCDTSVNAVKQMLRLRKGGIRLPRTNGNY